jgi:hypothetical protein
MNNISIKNVIMGSVLAVAAVTSLPANAKSVCAGGPAGNGESFAAGVGTSSFIKQGFTPKCSANVFMDGEEVSATVFAAGAASSKGKHFFGGSTVGGAVGNLGKCAADPDPCATKDAASGVTEAKKLS